MYSAAEKVRWIEVPKSSKSIPRATRPRRQAPSSTSFVRSAISPRPPRGHNATREPRYILPHESTDPSRAIMTCSILPLQLKTCGPIRLRLHVAARSCAVETTAVEAEPRAHPCLRVLCMTACRDGDEPTNAYPLVPLQPPTCNGCFELPRLCLLEFSYDARSWSVQGHAWLGVLLGGCRLVLLWEVRG